MRKQRLQKIISANGLCSRREAERLITESRILINGKVAQIGDQADPLIDLILVDNCPIEIKTSNKVYLVNKPIGFISSCKDNHGRSTVISLLPKNLQKGIHPVGRLDLNSRGAIILTNFGKLTLHLTHPRYSHSKTYQVWLEGMPSKESIDKWRSGVTLDGKKTQPAKIKVLTRSKEKCLVEVIIKEGRKRQIRRVAELIGHTVIDLKRTAIANIQLNNLKEGDWRELHKDEWEPIIYKENIYKNNNLFL